jgi:Uncharacterized conserved protein
MARLAEPALADLYAASPVERIALVKTGISAALITRLADRMAISRQRLYGMLGMARATIDRKISAGVRLDVHESEAALGMARLIGQVEQMLMQSGSAGDETDAAKWLAAWLEQPLPALGKKPPATFMDTEEGRRMIAGLLSQMQSGAYA